MLYNCVWKTHDTGVFSRCGCAEFTADVDSADSVLADANRIVQGGHVGFYQGFRVEFAFKVDYTSLVIIRSPRNEVIKANQSTTYLELLHPIQ
jgi:hypothetical protein